MLKNSIKGITFLFFKKKKEARNAPEKNLLGQY